MNLCVECGAEMHPANGEDTCRLCRKNIAGFAPGRVIYADEQKQQKRRAA